MKKIVQTNFKFKKTRPEYEQACLKLAQPIANVKCLLWKVWIMNEDEKLAGGISLFEDEASAQAYLKGDIIAGIKSNPALSDVEIRVFDVIPEPTKITRGPVD